MPLRTLESEFGPSQFELTFEPVEGCKGADNVVLIRSAIKQVCRRHGYHATFMCRPNLPNAFSSGWHLHQSLLDNKSSNNVFVSNNNEILSTVGSNYLAGLLKFANEACILRRQRLMVINGIDQSHWHLLVMCGGGTTVVR